MKARIRLISSILIVLFHTVGLAGFLIPTYTTFFLQLVPFHLLLMALLLIISQQDKNRHFWVFIVVTYLAGFLIELLGTKTGLIFGEYRYQA